MKLTLSQQSEQSKIVYLFRYITPSVAVHFLAAAFLVVLVFDKVNMDYLYQWGSFLICALLVNVLVLTMFNRKNEEHEIDPNRWENVGAISTLLVSVVFSFAYCYLALFGDPLLWSSLSLIIVMHVSSLTFAFSSSKKVILSTALPIILPFVAALIFLAEPSAYLFAASIGLYLCIVLFMSFDTHNTLLHSFTMASKLTAETKLTGQLKVKLANSTFVDPDTQILNKRFFDLMINEEIRRAKRAGKNLTIALIGIDFFAEYLENYGLEKTTKTIQSIAKILSDATPRGGEFMTRFGTDKFALIAPNVQQSEMLAFTSKMLHLINLAEIEHQATKVKDSHKLSVSIGIAEFTPGKIIDVKELVTQAEYALNSAVKSGGNNMQVCVANVVTENSQALQANDLDGKPHVSESSNSSAA